MDLNEKNHAQLIITVPEENGKAEFGFGGCPGCLIEALAQAAVADTNLMMILAEALKAATLRRLQMRNGGDLQTSVNMPHRQN